MNNSNGKIVATFSKSLFDKMIPQSAMDLLPLKMESINKWKAPKLDVIYFIENLFDKDAEMTSEDGKVEKVNYKDYWNTIYTNCLDKFTDHSIQFDLIAHEYLPVPTSTVATPQIPSFLDDIYFGGVAKYYMCFDGLIDNALSESYFFSIGHVLESQNELDCSITLAQNLYYKQALQVLRNFIELLICQILFCQDSKSFRNWIQGNYRLPRLNGKDGILKTLETSKIITPLLSQRTAKSYRLLNSYIHSSEKNLIHRGSQKGMYKGYIFDYDYFKTWCKSFIDIVENGILLMDAHFEQLKLLNNNALTCDICHSTDAWKLKDQDEFAGIVYNNLECQVCKSITTVRETP
jgi:hypothetical protein